MKRRTFLLTSIVSISGFVLERLLSLNINRSPSSEDSFKRQLGALFSNVDDAKQIGERYLTLNPHEADLGVLLDGAGITSVDSIKAMKHSISERRKQDFLRGDTIVLDGWILARSEVYVCAILAIS